MARIEELGDEATVSDTAPPPPTAETPFPLRPKPTEQDVSTTPSLPPAMDSVRSHTADEIVQMMKKTPLFMTDLADSADGRPAPFSPHTLQSPPHSSHNINPKNHETQTDEYSVLDQEENLELEAFKALQYEGTRAEIALGFKERGNEMVAEKRWVDAKEFYTKGIAALKAPLPAAQVESPASEEEQRKEREKERKVEEACYVNRALCNLEIRTIHGPYLHRSPHPYTSLPFLSPHPHHLPIYTHSPKTQD